MKTLSATLLLLFALQVRAQNTGIGTATPQAPLHIKTSSFEVLRIEGSDPYISFFDGSTYRGYLWYAGNRMELGTSSAQPVVLRANYVDVAHFTSDGRVGINTNAPTERLDVAGNINLRGHLNLNGNAGTYGQVYVTGGPDLSPQWKTMALANNTRFAVNFQKNAGSSAGDAAISITRYNLNTSDVTIGSNTITINRSGLYHFDLQVQANISYGSSQSVFPYFLLWFYTGEPNSYKFMDSRIMQPTSTANQFFQVDDKFTLDVYISAPATLRIHHSFGLSGGTSHSVSGFLSGHLISE